MKFNLLLATIFIGICLSFTRAGLIGSKQSVAVVGRLFCKGNFTQQQLPVLLYDRDLGDPDDLMGESDSQVHGSFYVEGYETEISNIDPEIRIHHNCRGGNQCVKIEIPDDYISSGIHPQKVFDAGTIHLDKHESNC